MCGRSFIAPIARRCERGCPTQRDVGSQSRLTLAVARALASMRITMDATELLPTRPSNGRLREPAPDPETLRIALHAAVRAPDHAGLTPFRFCLVRGEARAKLGEVFAAATQRRAPSGPSEAVEKARKTPLRAPLMIVV